MTTRRSNSTGTLYRRTKGGAWHAKYYDADGRRRSTNTRTTDRRAAERILAKHVSDAALRREGVVDTAGERLALHAKRPIAEHLDDWKATLHAKGSTGRHVELVTGRAGKVLAGCGFATWADVTASGVMAYLGELRRDRTEGGKVTRGVSPQTFNFYLQAVKQFAKWMVADRRAADDPLAGLKGLNVRTDRRHDRRALMADELRRLITETRRQGVERLHMDASQRATLYRLAAETGLRAGEARSLTPASFDLDASTPTVTVAAAYSKRRREDVLPMRRDLADELRRYMEGRGPDAAAFDMPASDKTADMMRSDVEAAGLTYRDASGKVADFHSLRHTFITNLANGGVHPSTAQALARHSTITLTMDRYTHRHAGDETAALEALPDMSTPAAEPDTLAATGTDDATPRRGGGDSGVDSGDSSVDSLSANGREAVRSHAKGDGNRNGGGVTHCVEKQWECEDMRDGATVGVGFEPTETRRPRRFSRPVHSTTLPPHRGLGPGTPAL